SVSNLIRSRHARIFGANPSVLHAARAQLVEFNNLHSDEIHEVCHQYMPLRDHIIDCGAMET
nr:6 kDa protein 2 [Chilli veinal mottle virus]